MIELRKCGDDFTLEKILAGIHYFRCHDYIELVSLVNILPQFISEHAKVQIAEVQIGMPIAVN